MMSSLGQSGQGRSPDFCTPWPGNAAGRRMEGDVVVADGALDDIAEHMVEADISCMLVKPGTLTFYRRR